MLYSSAIVVANIIAQRSPTVAPVHPYSDLACTTVAVLSATVRRIVIYTTHTYRAHANRMCLK
jgi:hypothetical protein